MSVELVLLVTAEADVDAGMAFAGQIARRNDYSAQVCVISEKPDALVTLVETQIQRWDQDIAVTTGERQADKLVESLNSNPALRLLIVPGLNQWEDWHKTLMRDAHAAVVCFEPHTGLLRGPSRLRRLGEDKRKAARWLHQHWDSTLNLVESNIEALESMVSPANSPNVADTAEADSDVTTVSEVVVMSVDRQSLDSVRKLSRRAIEAAPGPVVVVRGELSWFQWATQAKATAIVTALVPQMNRDTRRTLSESLTNFSRPDFEFIALICSATFLASFGLVQNSAAVIIGAMLVAPLMTPILGAGLSLAQGNRPLFSSSLRTIVMGFLAALATSFLFGCLLRVLPNGFLKPGPNGVELTSEMWSRTTPTLIDFLVGLVGGAAAAFARTRNHLSSALAGAAIAAALVPPIATSGLQLSLLFQKVCVPGGGEPARSLVYGPALLFIANMLTIMIGSSFVLWACGVRSDSGISLSQRWSTRMVMLLMTLTAVVAVWIVQHP